MRDAADRDSSLNTHIAVQEVQPAANFVERISNSPEKEKRKKSGRREAKDAGEPFESKREFIIPIASSPKLMNQISHPKQKRSKKKRKSETVDT